MSWQNLRMNDALRAALFEYEDELVRRFNETNDPDCLRQKAFVEMVLINAGEPKPDLDAEEE